MSGNPGRVDKFFEQLLKTWGCISPWLSLEVLLTRTRRPNGGDIIVCRAFGVALWMFLLATLIVGSFHLTWFGALFAAVYFALYARFAAQWTYLANLYNQIKGVEARVSNTDDSKRVLAEWKAGFLEDAEELHLATKTVFVSVLKIWAEDKEVEAQYIANTPGGKTRFDALMKDILAAYERHEKKFTERGRFGAN
jgi:hypothetical protein